MALRYTSTLVFARTLDVIGHVPSWSEGSTPTYENVGTGDDSVTSFYLDNRWIIAGSYTLYHGATQAASTVLTETTHYTLDKDTGEITLTAGGVTEVSTNNIYGVYKYFKNGMSNDHVNAALSASEKLVEGMINSYATDGTATNPDYPSNTEIQSSMGFWQDTYFSEKRPLVDITSTLGAALTSSATTVTLASSSDVDKFPSSGYIIIESEVIQYTGVSSDTLTGCTRGSMGTTAAAHDDETDVHTTIMFRSNTTEGAAVSWEVQPWDTSMYATSDGLFYKFQDSSPDQLFAQGVASRVKLIYYYGLSEVYEDFIRLVHLLARKALTNDTIMKSLFAGRDEFDPGILGVDDWEIKMIMGKYMVYPMGNT